MFAARLDLDLALDRARGAETDVSAGWLDIAPRGYDFVHRSVDLPAGSDLRRCRDGLLDWSLHRASGLRVRSDGTARPGTTVVVAMRVGPLWAVAPCRVLTTTDAEDRVGFTYATLPGHPEHGVEAFELVHDAAGARFEVRAVSRPTLWVSRRFPLPQRAVQRLAIRRYLDAALALARGRP